MVKHINKTNRKCDPKQGFFSLPQLKVSRVASGVIWSIGANTVVKIRGFLIAIIISRSMGMEWYGAYSLVYALISYSVILSTLSLPNAIVRFFPEEQDRNDLFLFILSIVIILSLIMTLPIILFTDQFAILFLKDILFSDLIFWGAFFVTLHSVQLLVQDYYRANENLRLFSIFQASLYVIELLSLTVALVFGRDLVFFLQLYLFIAMIVFFVPVLNILRKSDIRRVYCRENGTRIAKYLKYSLPLVPTSFTSLIASNGDRFLIGFFLGAEAIGLYGVVYALASVIMLLNSPFTNALFPRIVRLFQARDIAAVKAYVNRGVAAFSVIGMGILFLYWLVGEPLFYIMMGQSRYIAGDEATEVLRVLLIVLIALVSYGSARIYSLHLFVHNRTMELFWIYLSTALANVALNLLLIPALGLIGAAIATLLAYSVAGILTWIQVKRSYQKGCAD